MRWIVDGGEGGGVGWGGMLYVLRGGGDVEGKVEDEVGLEDGWENGMK